MVDFWRMPSGPPYPGDMSDGEGAKVESAETCPLAKSHGRLHQAHRLWHILLDAYPRPDDFILHLNASVEGFRNVTFILQNEMKTIVPDADNWYTGWQDRMRADPIMRWLNDSRATVVHKGDLETYSTATVSIHASWYGPAEIVSFEVPPFLATEAIGKMLMSRLNPPEDFQKEGVLEIERRWVEKRLPDWEILDALKHCYGVLSELLTDAHNRCGVEMRDTFGWEHAAVPTDHLEKSLPCMLTSQRERTALVHLGTGKILKLESKIVPCGDPEELDKEAKRYGLESLSKLFEATAAAKPDLDRDSSFLRLAASFVEVGKKILVADGFHLTMAFIYTPDGKSEIFQLMPEDQQGKYLMVQQVADYVRQAGADQLLFITETWSAPDDVLAPGERPVESPSRTERLLFVAVTARGPERSCQWLVPFSRNESGEFEFEPTKEGWIGFPQFLAPVFAVWDELWPTDVPPVWLDAASSLPTV